MQEHSREKHKWVKAQGDRWRPASVQTFFQGNKRKFFEVAETRTQDTTKQSTSIEALIDALLKEGERQDQEEARQEARVDEEQLPVDDTPWMRKTRWARKFAGRDLRAVAALSEKPSKDEGSLKRVWNSVGRVFDRCRGSVSTWRDDEEDGDLVLGWLNSPQKEKFNPDPFIIYYETSTHEKYTAYWKRFICYCLRLLHADDRHGHAFSAREQESLQELWGILELEDENEAALDTRVFDLSISFWTHENRAHSKSAIVHFCAVLGIDGKKGGYRPPSDYGQILAALLYYARLLMLS